ncbi:NSFL1 cofactor p47 [Trichoplax sp. H2]|nr:NSFL1 cofactor p47 [Trichoplax sp. H2]|eukprot:RDD44992.1 NSFL1 cofactor p47 [Trichoplax sp. H2]
MADSETSMIANFVSIAGTDADQARFYLEASNWNLKLALARYYDRGDDSFEDSEVSTQLFVREDQRAGGAVRQQKQKSRPKFASSSDYFKPDDDEEEDEAGQEFYAGGSEKSGQVVKGPPRKKTPSSIAESVFKEAKAHGAEAVSPDEDDGEKAKMAPFGGSGHRLGDEDGPSTGAATSLTSSQAPKDTKKVNINIQFWANGFSVDDGPLRDPNDPANKQFLEEVSKGYVPSELMAMAKGREVAVNLVDKRSEDYVKPKQKLKAFTGQGHMLGSDDNGEDNDEQPLLDARYSNNSWWRSMYIVLQLFVMRMLVNLGFFSPAPAVSSQTSSTSATSNEPQNTVKPNVDESQPTTSITIRLSDGTRLVTRMNVSSTVGDLRQFISRARPLPPGSKFNLLTTFPNKILDNDSLTLESGNLLNSVIVQRLA